MAAALCIARAFLVSRVHLRNRRHAVFNVGRKALVPIGHRLFPNFCTSKTANASIRLSRLATFASSGRCASRVCRKIAGTVLTATAASLCRAIGIVFKIAAALLAALSRVLPTLFGVHGAKSSFRHVRLQSFILTAGAEIGCDWGTEFRHRRLNKTKRLWRCVMEGVIYLVGLIVVVMAVLSFFGLR